MIGVIVGVVVLVLTASALGFVWYQRAYATTPAQLLPKDTLAYIAVANYREGDATNPWINLQQLLRNFPLAKDLQIADSANSFRRAISQSLGGTVALEKIPDIGEEITVGLTYLPDSAKKLSLLFTPDTGSRVAGITSNAEAAEPTTPGIAPADLPGIVVFVPLKNPIELLNLLRQISDESQVDIQPISGEKLIYKITPKGALEQQRKSYTQVREIYSTLVGRHLVFGLRLEDIKKVTDNSSLFGLPGAGDSFASVAAYKNIVREVEKERPLAWYVTQDPFKNPGRLFSFFTASQTAKVADKKAEGTYLAGRLVAETEGIRLHSWYPTLASTEHLKPTSQEQNLISKLPEKILGDWVSLYIEQRDVDGILGWSLRDGNDDIKGMLQKIGQEVLGLDIEKEVLPVLSGKTALMLAPRYDGNPPHAALVVESEENETVLRDKVNKSFSAIQAAWEKKIADDLEQNRQTLERYREIYSSSGSSLPSYLQDLRTAPARVERVEEPFRSTQIVTLKIPDSRALLGVQQLSYMVSGQRLVVATETQAVKELADSLQGQGPFPPLLRSTALSAQIQRHPAATTHFTYLYPQGIVGILKWALCGSGGLCQVGDPSTEAIAEVISSHLLVTRTLGSSFTEQDGGASEAVFLQLLPLSAEQQQKFSEAAKQLGIGESELSETGSGVGGFLEEMLGGLFQRSISPEDSYRPGSSSSPGAKSNDARIKSNIGQLRTLAEVFYDSNKASYAGVDSCFTTPTATTCKDASIASSVQMLKDDLATAMGGVSNLETNATSAAFCISHSLRSAGSSVCVDATGQFVESPTATCGVAATQCPK